MRLNWTVLSGKSRKATVEAEEIPPDSGCQIHGQGTGRRLGRILLPVKIAIAAAVLIVAGLDSFYILSENEMAVLTTFGSPSSVTTSGLKFKLPFIQQVYKMSKEIKGMPIGYSHSYESSAGSGQLEEEAVSVPDD